MTTNDPDPWATIIGPCYTPESIARELEWAPEQVTAAAASLTLLQLETDDGMLLYPAFRIWEGRLVEGLSDVIQELKTGTASRWTWAQWLAAPFDDGTGEDAPSAIEQLKSGQIASVFLDARHAAAAWGSR